jgi:hypothetical protein
MKIEHPTNREDLRLSILIYALTGAGKTAFCGTVQDCPETSPTLLINVGGGPNTLAGKHMDILNPKSLEDFQTILRLLFTKNLVPGSKYQYKSVCLDGITGFQQELSMPEVQGIRPAGQADDYSNLAASVPPDRRDWLFAHEHSRRTLRAFRDLSDPTFERKIHVILTALEKKDDMRSIVCPDLPGKLGVECGAYVDVLARLSIETQEQDDKTVEYRKLWVRQDMSTEGLTVLAKNRGGFLGKSMVNPTMAKIYKRWMEAK